MDLQYQLTGSSYSVYRQFPSIYKTAFSIYKLANSIYLSIFSIYESPFRDTYKALQLFSNHISSVFDFSQEFIMFNKVLFFQLIQYQPNRFILLILPFIGQ